MFLGTAGVRALWQQELVGQGAEGPGPLESGWRWGLEVCRGAGACAGLRKALPPWLTQGHTSPPSRGLLCPDPVLPLLPVGSGQVTCISLSYPREGIKVKALLWGLTAWPAGSILGAAQQGPAATLKELLPTGASPPHLSHHGVTWSPDSPGPDSRPVGARSQTQT